MAASALLRNDDAELPAAYHRLGLIDKVAWTEVPLALGLSRGRLHGQLGLNDSRWSTPATPSRVDRPNPKEPPWGVWVSRKRSVERGMGGLGHEPTRDLPIGHQWSELRFIGPPYNSHPNRMIQGVHITVESARVRQ